MVKVTFCSIQMIITETDSKLGGIYHFLINLIVAVLVPGRACAVCELETSTQLWAMLSRSSNSPSAQRHHRSASSWGSGYGFWPLFLSSFEMSKVQDTRA